MHVGDPKVLYGVPGSCAFRFEEVKKRFVEFITGDSKSHSGPVSAPISIILGLNFTISM